MKKIFTTTSLLIIALIAIAQPGSNINPENQLKYIDILSPSPSTASLSNFNRPSVGLSSGTASFSAPLLTVPVKSFNLPITLSYQSNGVLVDEIASRVGISWQLSAGGSISRVVQDAVDETTFLDLPLNVQTYSKEFLDYLRQATMGSTFMIGPDTQPDIFSYSFGSYSGKFILDPNDNVVQLNQTNLKIENPVFNGSTYVFRITDPEGNKFYFGGGDGYAEQSAKASSCGKGSGGVNAVTAWFLKKIELATGQLIEFTYSGVDYYYDQGFNETMYYNIPPEFYPTAPPCSFYGPTRCINSTFTRTKYVTSITTPERVINFLYSSRQDSDDKLLNSIEVRLQSDNSLVETYTLNYQVVYTTKFNNSYAVVQNNQNRYRPFLSNIVKQAGSESVVLYRFSYNSPEDLPVRISFAQDHWGYFNGANNDTMIPAPEVELTYLFPDADSNREPVFEHASKGMLTRITYPTGGSDTITYEANTLYTQVATYPTRATRTANITGLGEREIRTKNIGPPFQVSFTQKMDYNVDGFNVTGGQPQSYHQGGIKIYQNGNLMTTITVLPGEHEAGEFLLVPGNSYTVDVWAGGSLMKAEGTLGFAPGSVVYNNVNKATGGVRVKNILTYSNDGTLVEQKHYRYSSFDKLNESSGEVSFDPYYLRGFNHRNYAWDIGDVGCPDTYECNFLSMTSSSINSLFTYTSNPVQYRTVIESQDESFTNGLTEHTYSIQKASTGQMLLGTYPNGAPLSRHGENMNGKELSTRFYKNKSGTMKLLKQMRYTYKNLNTQLYYGVVVNKKFEGCANWDVNALIKNPQEFEPYEAYRYMFVSSWVVADSVIEENFDDLSNLRLVNASKYHFDNSLSKLPTKVVARSSQGEDVITNNFYVNDAALFSGLTPLQIQVLGDMVTKNIVSPLICQTQYKNTQLVRKYLASYKQWPGMILPETVKEFFGQETNGNLFQIKSYDTEGNILEREKNGIIESYLWDYKLVYPTAKVIGAGKADIAATSFEAEENGNWTTSGGLIVTDLSAPTGKKCFQIGTLSKTITPSKTYVLSYWFKAGSSVQLTLSAGGTVQSTFTESGKDGWSVTTAVLSGAASITLGGTGYIDEVRLHPKGALMTTITYDPMIGQTSVTDANNFSNYYTYDKLGRLKAVRDSKGNLLKTVEYNYVPSN